MRTGSPPHHDAGQRHRHTETEERKEPNEPKPHEAAHAHPLFEASLVSMRQHKPAQDKEEIHSQIVAAQTKSEKMGRVAYHDGNRRDAPHAVQGMEYLCIADAIPGRVSYRGYLLFQHVAAFSEVKLEEHWAGRIKTLTSPSNGQAPTCTTSRGAALAKPRAGANCGTSFRGAREQMASIIHTTQNSLNQSKCRKNDATNIPQAAPSQAISRNRSAPDTNASRCHARRKCAAITRINSNNPTTPDSTATSKKVLCGGRFSPAKREALEA